MQERPSASVILMACGIVSGYSPPCSIVSNVRPDPFMFGPWGRFSGGISSNLWVSFIRYFSSACAFPMCVFALGIEDPLLMAVDSRQHSHLAEDHRARFVGGASDALH